MTSSRPLLSLSRLLLLVCAIAIVGSAIWIGIRSQQVRQLTLAAGDPEGESYILSQVIAKVVAANYPRLHLNVLPTNGTDASLRLLDSGKADLATAQADVPTVSAARAIAVLYRDLFQLVVRRDAGIHAFPDLASHRVLLQPNSGEFYSFMALAKYYGLDVQSLMLRFASDRQADDLFRQKQAEALFRVRTLNNKYLARVVRQTQAELLPIEQAEALQIGHPALEVGSIPQGGYQGNPLVPDRRLPTVAVPRLLLARKTLDNSTVRAIAQVLEEHRRDIARAIPEEFAELRSLVATIQRPSFTSGTGIPTHPGAIAYYDRDRPTWFSATLAFLLHNAGLFVALITLPAGSLLGLWEGWQRFKQRADERRLLADRLIRDAIETMEPEEAADPRDRQRRLQAKLDALERLFNEAADAVVRENITQEAFRTFNEAYTTTRNVLDRRRLLASEEIADDYVRQVLDGQTTTALDAIVQAVERSLVGKEISQESFRTVIEAYKTARDRLQAADP